MRRVVHVLAAIAALTAAGFAGADADTASAARCLAEGTRRCCRGGGGGGGGRGRR